MSVFRAVIFVAMFYFLLLGVSCKQNTENGRAEDSALQEYVNVPKERARGAAKQVEGAQRRARQQAADLEEENEADEPDDEADE